MKTRVHFPVFIFVIAIILSSCSTSGLDEENMDELFKKAPSQEIKLVDEGGYANYDLKAQNIVIKDENAFEHFWNNLHESVNPNPAVPEIDFSINMVLVSIMGSKPHGGYFVQIDNAIYVDNTFVAKVKKTSPRNCFTTQAITNPYVIVKVEKTDSPVDFFEKSVVHDCSE